MRNLYHRLNLSPSASEDDIKTAISHSSDMSLRNDAIEVLAIPERKLIYDQNLKTLLCIAHMRANLQLEHTDNWIHLTEDYRCLPDIEPSKSFAFWKKVHIDPQYQEHSAPLRALGSALASIFVILTAPLYLPLWLWRRVIASDIGAVVSQSWKAVCSASRLFILRLIRIVALGSISIIVPGIVLMGGIVLDRIYKSNAATVVDQATHYPSAQSSDASSVNWDTAQMRASQALATAGFANDEKTSKHQANAAFTSSVSDHQGISRERLSVTLAAAEPTWALTPQRRPTNGSFNEYQNRQVRAPLEIVTNGSRDYLVKLFDASTGRKAVDVYVRADSSSRVQVPVGDYLIRYVSGVTWYGHDQLFGPDTLSSHSQTVLSFIGEGSRYRGYSIRLGGNTDDHVQMAKIEPYWR